MRRGFLTGGTWCADHNKLLDRWPSEDTVTEIISETVEGGGSACNLAIDMLRLDPTMPVATIGCIGEDADGAIMLEQAREAGIDCTQLHVLKGERTNFTDAFTARATGRRTHIYLAGTSRLLSPDHFDFSTTNARIFHLGLPGIHRIMDSPWKNEANGWVATLKAARAVGLQTNFELVQIEPDRLRAYVAPCLPHLDMLVINDYEVGALADRRTTDDGRTDLQACLEAGAAVMQQGAMKLLVIHFPGGALAFGRDGKVTRCPSVSVPPSEVKGANGAGDAFAAGFLYGVHEEWPVADALRLAHATAAASLRTVGTTGSIEPWQRCLDLADRWGWRDMAEA